MKIYFTLFVFLISSLIGTEKSKLDVHQSSLAKSSSTIQQNQQLTFTLLPGGYFTIGTGSGLTNSPLDDNCQITFGHPYALTSFPLISINGEWKRPEQIYPDFFGQKVRHEGTTSSVVMGENTAQKFNMHFTENANGTITIALSIKNIGTVAQNLGLGLVMDLALGKNGDGEIEFLDNNSESMNFWERTESPKGLGANLIFDTPPDLTQKINWPYVYENHAAAFQLASQIQNYDAALVAHWYERELAPGDSLSVSGELKLIQPEFSDLFMRTNLPTAFSIENNQLFPDELTAQVDITNTSGTPQNNLSVHAMLPEMLSGETEQHIASIENGTHEPAYFSIKTHERFESFVKDVIFEVRSGTEVLDQLKRPVFFPAVPVSDTGLVVTIDSTFEENGYINLYFSTTKGSNQQPVKDLKNENIFLFQNEQRTTDFELSKVKKAGPPNADFIIVLDVSSSMTDEIEGVKQYTLEFIDSLSVQGLDVQLGMVTFVDEIKTVFELSSDLTVIKNEIDQLEIQFDPNNNTWPENSLDALARASEFNFRENSSRTIIWITDYDYHENNSFTSYTRQDVIDKILKNGIVVFAVGAPEFQLDYYDQITISTGGDYYDIHDNFRDILLDISRSFTQLTDLLKFSLNDEGSLQNIRLKIHYAGLGGETTLEYTPVVGKVLAKPLACYPNPFNPQINIAIQNPRHHSGEVHIFNLLGQRVWRQNLNPARAQDVIRWNARQMNGTTVSSGYYFISLIFRDASGSVLTRENVKVLHLK